MERYFIGGTGASAIITDVQGYGYRLVIYDYKGEMVESRYYKTYNGARIALGRLSCGFQQEVSVQEFWAFDRYGWCGGRGKKSGRVMKYRVKDEFVDLWTSEDIYPLIVSDDEIKFLAEGWGVPVSELMEEVESEVE